MKNNEINLEKESKKEATKNSYAKRRSPRAERLSKKLTVEVKPLKPESKLPKNLDQSSSFEKAKEVSAKKKLDKSNSQKVKKVQAPDSTKYASVTTSKFTQATTTNWTTSSTINSQSSQNTAVVSAVQSHPDIKENKKPATNVQSTAVKPYEPKKPHATRKSNISDVVTVVSKP